MTVVESPKGRASHNLGNRGAIPPFPPPGYCYIFFQNLSRKESSSPPAPSRFRLILRLEKTLAAGPAPSQNSPPVNDVLPVDFERGTRYGRDIEARYPSGKGEVCKTFMRGFDSHPRLQHFPLIPSLGNCRRLATVRARLG